VYSVPVLDPLLLNHPAAAQRVVMRHMRTRDMRIRLLLREMKLRHDIGPADRDRIERILSGKALLDSQEFDRECCSASQQ
jgi:hypothetical protein